MALDSNIVGALSGTGADVDADRQVLVKANSDPAKAGAAVAHFENDDGTYTGSAYYKSPEVDEDYRLRVGTDAVLDAESFYYTAQNTGKHRYGNTTLTATWSTGGLTLNGAGVTTTTTGAEIRTYAFFPLFGSGNLYCEVVAAFTAQPTVNVIVEFGLGLTNNTGTAAPSDGAFFRLTSAGMVAVCSFGGSETTVAVPVAFTYANNQACKFQIAVTLREVEFWIDDSRVASVEVPISSGTPFSCLSMPWFAQQRHPGTASAVLQTKIFNYVVTLGGVTQTTDFDDIGNALYGSYQGLSGGTMGSLANFANSANPTAAVPTNTTAALGSGLGGQFWETDTLAVTTDGVICSYQVPAGTIAIPGRRLVLKGVKVESFIQTALTGGGYNAVWSLAFGHTAVSLATAEAATAKAPRRIPLGVQSVASGAAALVQLSTVYVDLTRPVVVNPGEFVAVVKKKVGTAPSAGVVAHYITFDYGWV
jgi:hypothetical protein